MAMAVSSPEPGNIGYQRQASTDSGWDNPFRPDGNLSREADEIVELIKGGKPITPTSGAAPAPSPTTDALPAADGASVPDGAPPTATASPQHAAAPGSPAAVATAVPLQNSAKVGANGNAAAGGGGGVGAGDGTKAAAPGSVEVQRGTVDASQAVEHVVLKKKQKCKCCVIQ